MEAELQAFLRELHTEQQAKLHAHYIYQDSKLFSYIMNVVVNLLPSCWSGAEIKCPKCACCAAQTAHMLVSS